MRTPLARTGACLRSPNKAMMARTTSLHSFFRTLTRRSCRTASHPDAVPKTWLSLPRRIDDPASAARVARDLLRSRREDVVLVLCMDDRYRFVGHAVVMGWLWWIT